MNIRNPEYGIAVLLVLLICLMVGCVSETSSSGATLDRRVATRRLLDEEALARIEAEAESAVRDADFKRAHRILGRRVRAGPLLRAEPEDSETAGRT